MKDPKKYIVFTVTNDLVYDQRMIRICNSLQAAGYLITLIGTKNKQSPNLIQQEFRQKRLFIPFKKGPLFYLYYNSYLFLVLLCTKADCFCAIDLDTIIPVYLTALLKKKDKVYDAHEYFSQQKEVITRPHVYKIWHFIEKKIVPKFLSGYTVSKAIADEFNTIYGVDYLTIRNMPLKVQQENSNVIIKAIIYQGAVNEGRGLEYLIPAMAEVNIPLHIYGDGNFMKSSRLLVSQRGLQDKIIFKGKLLPHQLNSLSKNYYIGINLVEPLGLNQYFSLANKFFDYIHNGIPQVTMKFPEYRNINEKFQIAILLSDLKTKSISEAINKLINNPTLYSELKLNCLYASDILNWQNEEKKLVTFYNDLLLANK